MKLYLDDVRPVPDDTWTGVDNIESAKDLLLSGVVEELSLDHDLGGNCPGGCWEDDEESQAMKQLCGRVCECACHSTGMDLLMWMVRNDIWSKKKPVVHSANVVRAPVMKAVINEEWARRSKNGK